LEHRACAWRRDGARRGGRRGKLTGMAERRGRSHPMRVAGCERGRSPPMRATERECRWSPLCVLQVCTSHFLLTCEIR
jgi:hypothetical protein